MVMYLDITAVKRYIYSCCYAGIDPAKEELILEELYDRVYGNFVEEVDAVDNGISAFDGTPRWVCSRMCASMLCTCTCI